MSRGLCFFLVASVTACGSVRVRPTDLPPVPSAQVHPDVLLVLDAAPAEMADEARRISAAIGHTQEVGLGADRSVVGACNSGVTGVVLHPRLGRTHFASDAGDRNLFLIYESAIVVGLPVALVSVAVWPWHGETTVEGILEVLPCGGSNSSTIVESFRLQSSGRGFMPAGTLAEEQGAEAKRGVTRKLFAAWLAEGATAQGGEK